MNDLETAVRTLGEHAVCLCKDGRCLTGDGKGLAPLMRFFADGIDLRGYSAADTVVGKAAALLFVKAGVTAVHGRVMSQSAEQYLRSRQVACSCDSLTERIMNRAGTVLCPMEKAVEGIDDENKGYEVLHRKMKEMQTRSEMAWNP